MVDLVLANLGAYKFIAGTAVPWPSPGGNSLGRQTLVLTHNGVVKVSAPLAGALTIAWQIGGWLAPEAKGRDMKIPSYGLVLTGTCGGALLIGAGGYEVS